MVIQGDFKVLDATYEALYGTYEVWADNMTAEVRFISNGTTKVLAKFRGESAWSDADRWASDKAWPRR